MLFVNIGMLNIHIELLKYPQLKAVIDSKPELHAMSIVDMLEKIYSEIGFTDYLPTDSVFESFPRVENFLRGKK